MKTKLTILFVFTAPFYASADKLEISSETTKADLVKQLTANQPTQEELFEAWDAANDLGRQDLSDFLWLYVIGEQPLPQPQAAKSEVKEEKSETKECGICYGAQDLISMPCCSQNACQGCITKTSEGYSLDETTNVDGRVVRTRDTYEVKKCPFCRESVDLKGLATRIGTNPDEKPAQYDFLNDEQFAKLIHLAEASGIDIDTYLGRLSDEDFARIEMVIDANYEAMVRTQQRTQPRRPVMNNNANIDNRHNVQNAPQRQAPRRIVPLVLNADRANAQFGACQMMSAVVVIVAAVLMYSRLGGV